MKVPKEYAGLARSARRQGWKITRTGSNHLRWTNPEGRSVFTPATPGTTYTGILPILRKLQNAGLVIADRHPAPRSR
jgi:hypothetical protein